MRMCVTPTTLDDGQRVACRHCWVCRSNRVNDVVGRCIAEAETSCSTVVVTLTYAGDVPQTAFLQYSDVQNFLKRLRKITPVRFLCVGEYGSLKGRAHWHMILFFSKDNPLEGYQYRSFIEWPTWGHGHVYLDAFHQRTARYVCKYMLKNQDDRTGQFRVSRSLVPPLGRQFFDNLCDDYVQQGHVITSPVYSFPNVKDRHGKARQFHMTGATLSRFLDRYQIIWRLERGEEPPDTEWLLEKYLDPIAETEMEDKRWR